MNLLKKIFICFFLFFFLYAEIDIKKSRDLERKTSDEIELILSKVLERKTFVVSVSAEVDKKVIREIKEEEENTHTKEPIIIPKETPQPQVQPTQPTKPKTVEDEFENLGFPDLDEEEQQKQQIPKTNNNQVQEIPEKVTTSGVYRVFDYRNEYQVLSVNVAVIFDQTIPIETRQSLQSLISRTITAKYKDKGSVDFSVSDLKNKHPKKIIDYIQEYISLFYIALGLIVFFIILMIVLFLMRVLLSAPQRKERRDDRFSSRPIVVRPKKISKKKNDSLPNDRNNSLPPNNNFNQPKQVAQNDIGIVDQKKTEKKNDEDQEDFLYDIFMQKENEFIQIFLKDPLASRKYFVSLKQEEQEKMLSAITAENIKKIFQNIKPNLNLEKDVFSDDNNKSKEIRDKIKFFEKSIKDLKQFKKFTDLQNYGHFGSLSLLNKEEITDILDGIEIKELALIMKNIDREIIEFYIKQLSEDKKRELIKVISDKQNITEEEVEKVSRVLNKKVSDSVEKNIFINNANKNQLFDMIINQTSNTKETLEQIKSGNKDLYEKYKHYGFDFIDFLEDNTDFYNKTISQCENDALGKALIGLEESQKEKFIASIPEVRKDLVLAIESSNRNTIKKEEVLEKQKEILNIYRRIHKESAFA